LRFVDCELGGGLLGFQQINPRLPRYGEVYGLQLFPIR
jgi:hypothetical protein